MLTGSGPTATQWWSIRREARRHADDTPSAEQAEKMKARAAEIDELFAADEATKSE